MAKVKLRHIPYRGSAPALQGLLAGDVDVMFDNLGVSLPLVQAGKLKLLAVASPNRLPALPDVPTIAETLPGFEAVAWYAIVAPPKTPKDDHRQDQCRRERGVASARGAGSVAKIVRRDFRRLGREDIQIYAGRDRSMGRGDQVGQDRVAVSAARAAGHRCMTCCGQIKQLRLSRLSGTAYSMLRLGRDRVIR